MRCISSDSQQMKQSLENYGSAERYGLSQVSRFTTLQKSNKAIESQGQDLGESIEKITAVDKSELHVVVDHSDQNAADEDSDDSIYQW